MKKKIILLAVAIVVFGIASVCIYSVITSDQKYHYLSYDEVPKGYVEYDGEVHSGKDYDHLFWYRYDEMPKLCDKYSQVGNKTRAVKLACNIMTLTNAAITTIDDNGKFVEEKEPDGYLAELVSEDDYYYMESHDADGKVIEGFDGDNFILFFYDTQTNTLYNCRWIW